MSRRRGNDAISRAGKLAEITRQTKREAERHQNKMAGLARQRDALGGVADPALRLAKLLKIDCDLVEERQRHQSKVETLVQRRWKAWQ